MKKIIYPGWAVPSSYYSDIFDEDVEIEEYGFFQDPPTFDIENRDYSFNKPVVIIGHSLGGIFAMEAAYKNRNVKAAVLVGGFPRFTSTDDYSFAQPAKNVEIMLQNLDTNAEKQLNSFYRTMTFPDKISITNNSCYDIEKLKAGLTILLDEDLRPILHEIDLPILLLHGKRDRIVDCKASSFLNNSLQNSYLELFNNRGHALPIADTSSINSNISDFLKKLEL
jgi:pimeloyl-ACP methyl ester carboxylesterase